MTEPTFDHQQLDRYPLLSLRVDFPDGIANSLVGFHWLVREGWLREFAWLLLVVVLPMGAVARGREPRGREPAERRVAVTIDDGPATGTESELTKFQEISRGLREAFVAEEVPAIMFVNERQLQVAGERDARVLVMSEWLSAGLELGNHTYSHLRLRDTELVDYFDDIIKGETVTRPLLQAVGQDLVWFRYPYLSSERGDKAEAVESFLAERDYRIAPVTVDYHDYSFSSQYCRYLRAGQAELAEEHFQNVLRALDQAFERAEETSRELLGYELPQVLLIHCNEMNALTLPRTLKRIRDRGYQFVSLETAMQDPAYDRPLPAGAMGGSFFQGLRTQSPQ